MRINNSLYVGAFIISVVIVVGIVSGCNPDNKKESITESTEITSSESISAANSTTETTAPITAVATETMVPTTATSIATTTQKETVTPTTEATAATPTISKQTETTKATTKTTTIPTTKATAAPTTVSTTETQNGTPTPAAFWYSWNWDDGTRTWTDINANMWNTDTGAYMGYDYAAMFHNPDGSMKTN